MLTPNQLTPVHVATVHAAVAAAAKFTDASAGLQELADLITEQDTRWTDAEEEATRLEAAGDDRVAAHHWHEAESARTILAALLPMAWARVADVIGLA